ncbi:unnamed protein product [Porites evermanni]|uniref:Uncharacterized protein n=1 Tax=Porites evermanni TaxID=104178 RepID=A0ABN8PSF4_9CNID|nr:unnamed protein product [Porites evermanni]
MLQRHLSESEGRAWPGSLPQHVFSACNSGRGGQQRQPQNLPPTFSAARYHSLRVFLQVKQWHCLSDRMQFEDWGWKLSGNQVIPVTTDHFSRVLAQDDPLQLCNWLCLCKV